VSPFFRSGSSDLAADEPLLPAQSALAFVLSAETWPVFRAWLVAQEGGMSTDTEDREDMERAFRALIAICQSMS
jgi:hypothetical protein